MTQQPSTWELAADDVIAVVMVERDWYENARFNQGLRPAHLPEKHGLALKIIYDLYDCGEPIHDTTILARANGQLELSWVAQHIALYDATRTGDVFSANVKLAIEEGTRQATSKLLTIAAGQITSGQNREQTLENLYSVLSGISSGRRIVNESAAQHGQLFRQRLEQPQKVIHSTGFNWLDGLTGGIQPAHLWWIVAAYKQRKTTFMLNMLLAQAVYGEKPALLSGEMTQEQVYWQLIAMLAIANLQKRGLYEETYKTAEGKLIPLNWIGGVSLRNAQQSYKRWHPEKIKAIDWALDFYESLNIRIYDSTDGLGGLSDLDSIRRVVGYDRARHAGKVYCGDYIQLFEAPGMNMVDKEAMKARALQNMTRKEGITMIWAAQKNEESVKGNNESYSPGVSGGGAVAQTADFLLVTQYKQRKEQSENDLTVEMKLSRHGPGGDGVKETFQIHPGSGLILYQDWHNKIDMGGSR